MGRSRLRRASAAFGGGAYAALSARHCRGAPPAAVAQGALCAQGFHRPLRGPCAHGPPRPAAIPPPRLPLRGTVAHLTAKGLRRADAARLGRVCAPWRPLPSAAAQCARVNAHPLHLQILLDFGGDKCYNIVSTKRALQPTVLFPQVFNANKGYHIFPARVKWYPLFFSSRSPQLLFREIQIPLKIHLLTLFCDLIPKRIIEAGARALHVRCFAG